MNLRFFGRGSQVLQNFEEGWGELIPWKARRHYAGDIKNIREISKLHWNKV